MCREKEEVDKKAGRKVGWGDMQKRWKADKKIGRWESRQEGRRRGRQEGGNVDRKEVGGGGR